MRSQEKQQRALESIWSGGSGDAIATLSVRSSLDLLLTELALPAGSEVLMSAITVPDMPRIVREHGLVPVPVDIHGADAQIDLQSLQQAVTSRSKMLIVAHLFGAISNLVEVQKITSQHGILLVEDCAQAWFHPEWRGSPEADVSLFSFGTIKTATALGGALSRVRDPELLHRMQEKQRCYPIQTRSKYFQKILKAGWIKMLSGCLMSAVLMTCCRWFLVDPDQWMSRLTRGFAHENLLQQLRARPCAALLSVLSRRLQSYPFRRIERRTENGILLKSATRMISDDTGKNTFWLFPHLTCQPDMLKQVLMEHGFDCTQRGRLQVVQGDEDQRCPQAESLLENSLFLPCYAEIPLVEIDRLNQVVEAYESSEVMPNEERVPAQDRGR